MPTQTLPSAIWATRLLNQLESGRGLPYPLEFMSQRHLVDEMTSNLPEVAPDISFARALRTYAVLIGLQDAFEGEPTAVEVLRMLSAIGAPADAAQLMSMMRTALRGRQ